MYKAILVPLDGSKRAEAILPHAEQLAQRYEAKVVFLQVVEPSSILMTPGKPELALHEQQTERRTEKARLYLRAVQGEFQEKGIEAQIELAQSPVVGAIIDAAARRKADIIALTSHGRSGLAQVFYGSVAAGVLERVDRPLLLVRSKTGD
jgi:nucleotide-binding universal stress UspA family protein